MQKQPSKNLRMNKTPSPRRQQTLRASGPVAFLLLVASLYTVLVCFSFSVWQVRPKFHVLDAAAFVPSVHLSTRMQLSSKGPWIQKPIMIQIISSDTKQTLEGAFPLSLWGMMVPSATNRTLEWAEKETPQYGMPRPLCGEPADPDCVIPGTWQQTNNMTCNPIHEIDLRDFFGRPTAGDETAVKAERLRIVGKGGKRLAWQYRELDGTWRALKMFQHRADREDDFSPETIELQRRDALIHEVTSSSPFIVNMYGYCAASALYDFADGGQLDTNVQNDGPPPRHELLRLSHRIAASVADLHHLDESGRPTIAHADIHGEQWVKVHGEYQLTDFNLAKLLKRSRRTNSTVPFRRDVVDHVSTAVMAKLLNAVGNRGQKFSHVVVVCLPLRLKWFSPEVHRQHYIAEDIVTEKMDIWNMGNVFYLIFVGRPPFDGVSRSSVRSILLEKHGRPEIPKDKRSSDDYLDQTMVKVIDMCMKENPEDRPTARQVATFLKASLNEHHGPYASIAEMNERSVRFPSVEKRVKLYMSSWYIPTCKDDPDASVQYQFVSKEGSSWQKVLVRELATHSDSSPEWDHVVEIFSDIGDDALLIDPGMLEDAHQPHAGYRADVIQTVLPLMDSLEGKPLLMQWGDRISFHLSPSHRNCQTPHSSLAIPHFKKCRPVLAKGELERITAAQCYGADRPHSNSSWKGRELDPIIWKLDSHRLLGPIDEVAKADKPWSEKRGKAVFRGKLTGHAMDTNGARLLLRGNMTEREYCNAIERCRFVLKHHNSSLVDARLTDVLGKPLNNSISGVALLGEKMTMQDLLEYKVLIMLEGNDVSSGLRWALRSNSLVMMPPPTFTTWVMEELLEPWVHYIPLDPSFNDTEEKMQWMLEHDEDAKRIASQGSLWIKDLLEHPNAENENIEINRHILERYQRLFVHSDQLVSDGKSQVVGKSRGEASCRYFRVMGHAEH